ncbi:hypothetical protein CDD80_6020 [Ophiocordyceps camponoti-rufipedis]|uniref:Uncharacterized protein n=1 Tax=Ophiocordyceps camponoti-rufipedis TaxID=2004952 RepID=A0A2C5YS20_9HYPO|nr:hypothetical protein CDD80_6020 [Ophiocordyceps camponoti-rufipedis]
MSSSGAVVTSSKIKSSDSQTSAAHFRQAESSTASSASRSRPTSFSDSNHVFTPSQSDAVRPLDTSTLISPENTKTNIVHSFRVSLNGSVQFAGISAANPGHPTHSNSPSRASFFNSTAASRSVHNDKTSAIVAGPGSTHVETPTGPKATKLRRVGRCRTQPSSVSSDGRDFPQSATGISQGPELDEAQAQALNPARKSRHGRCGAHSSTDDSGQHHPTSVSIASDSRASATRHAGPDLTATGSKAQADSLAAGSRTTPPQAKRPLETSMTFIAAFEASADSNLIHGVNSTGYPTVSFAAPTWQRSWGHRVLYLLPTLIVLSRWLT